MIASCENRGIVLPVRFDVDDMPGVPHLKDHSLVRSRVTLIWARRASAALATRRSP